MTADYFNSPTEQFATFARRRFEYDRSSPASKELIVLGLSAPDESIGWACGGVSGSLEFLFWLWVLSHRVSRLRNGLSFVSLSIR